MELLIAIIKDYSKVEEILLGFVEADVSGATVLEGQGMGQILGNVPIFADLRGHFPGSMHDSYVLISVVEASQVPACMKIVTQSCGPLENPATGIVFTLPVGQAFGLKMPT